jgi:hypothetical protein
VNSPISIRIGSDEVMINYYKMKPKTKQKKQLKKEVFEELSSWDLGYSKTLDIVNDKIFNCGKEISEILSDYYLRWESMKEQRDRILIIIQNQYPNLSKKEINGLVIEYLKEYWNSDEYKEGFGYQLSCCIEIEDVDY